MTGIPTGTPEANPCPRRDHMKPTKFWKGHYYPLGATWTGAGVNFALFSEYATGVELCLFDELGQPEVGSGSRRSDCHIGGSYRNCLLSR